LASIAAILAAGCEGIEKDLPLEAPVTSNLQSRQAETAAHAECVD
jgi:glutamine synthetase